jgi:hypothetical protein
MVNVMKKTSENNNDDNTNISRIESKIPSHKTMDEIKFISYMKYLVEHVVVLKKFYEDPWHRKLRFNRYVNTQKSEQRFLDGFAEKFGKQACIIMGDWSDGGHTLKYQTSSKTKGWEQTFKRNGYSFYLIDEYKTTSQNPNKECEDVEPEKILWRPNPRPWRRRGRLFAHKNWRKWSPVHGLLCCNNMKSKSKQSATFWNRDELSTENMLTIVKGVIAGNPRPDRFSRSDVRTG